MVNEPATRCTRAINVALTAVFYGSRMGRQNDAKHTIFIVDDDRDHAESIADLLELRGHEVEMAFTGEAAVKRFAEREFDLTLARRQAARHERGRGVLRHAASARRCPGHHDDGVQYRAPAVPGHAKRRARDSAQALRHPGAHAGHRSSKPIREDGLSHPPAAYRERPADPSLPAYPSLMETASGPFVPCATCITTA